MKPYEGLANAFYNLGVFSFIGVVVQILTSIKDVEEVLISRWIVPLAFTFLICCLFTGWRFEEIKKR